MVSAFVALGLLLAGILFASSAVAAPKPKPTSTCYPPGRCHAKIFSSTTTPVQGQRIKVSGKFYLPNENVRLTIGGVYVGTARTDADGAFDPPVTVPNLVGDQELSGVGASGLATDRDSLILTIRASGAAGAGDNAGGLASTGVQIAAFSLLGVVLLVGGGFLVLAARRRRAAHTA